MNDDYPFAPKMPGPNPVPFATTNPLAAPAVSKFEEVANKLEADISALDSEVCRLLDRLHLVLRSKLPVPPTQASGIPAPAAQPAPIIAGTQEMSREVNRIRDTITDILNRLEI